MRRMLDPKEAGGGSNKIYLHCIQLYGAGFGNIFTSFYTTNPEPFTMPLFQEFMKGKTLPCSGKISVDGVGKPRITSLQYSSLNNYAEVWYYDLDNPSGYRPVSTKKAKIEDMVSPL